MDEFKEKIESLKKASPLDIPSKLMEFELHDQETAFELFDRISSRFEKEDLMENVVNPSVCTIIDGVLALPCFKGITRKMGLSAQRVMNECRSFNYEGRLSFLMPDSQIESRNYAEQAESWRTEHRNKYERSKYQNIPAMNRYKQERVKENGGRVNMEDEYRMTRDIAASRATADQRRNDPKFDFVAETDHIDPLKTIFEQLQSNSGLSDEDIRRIANRDENFAVTGRLVNNPKRDMSNSDFIAKQDELKSQGKPYVELSEEQRKHMIRMERDAQSSINDGINDMVLRNLSGRGHADSESFRKAIAAKRKELGRELTPDESSALQRECAIQKTKEIYGGVAKNAASQGLMYAMGNTVLLILKPLYFELKDGFTNGFISGVYAGGIKEAFAVRFSRIRDYVWEQLTSIKTYLGGFFDFLKNLISSLIESLLNMFVGLFKQILRVAKEGVKIVMQASSILFGENAKKSSTNEKGDAIVKIIGGSIVAFCGIAIDTILEDLPESIRGLVSTLLSGIAGIIVFYALDKADLFNVKAERRNNRIKEIFDLRISEIKEKTRNLSGTALVLFKDSTIKVEEYLNCVSTSAVVEDYESVSNSLDKLYQLLFLQPIKIYDSGQVWNC